MKIPFIFDIKRGSSVDGPGLRTVIFFKGCNLDCFWCHNPEGKSPSSQVAFFREQCRACGACRKICTRGDAPCTGCGRCTETCPEHARRLYGKKYRAEELLEIILADRAFYEATGGGVTFSGGECMLYPEYLASVAALCHEQGISVAVDTAGCVPYASFETVLPYADVFLYDIKCLDPTLHAKGTGKENGLILENLDALCKTGKKILIRTPVIPTFNEGDEVERIKAFCSARNLPLELLPYHTFGEDKKNALDASSQGKEQHPPAR